MKTPRLAKIFLVKKILKKSKSGFTIVEIVTTIAVAGILMTLIATILNSQTHLAQKGRDLALSNAFAENKIESLRSKGFLALVDGTTTITNELPSELKIPKSATLAISAHNASMKLAVITITYNDQGINRTYSYSTYVGELGVGQ